MKRKWRLFNFFVFAPILPVSLFLSFWWASIPFAAESDIWKMALLGLGLGVLLDGLFLKTVLAEAFRLPLWLLILIYFFYSLIIFGFFMGMPVFNVLPGLVAGVFVGMKARRQNINRQQFLKRVRNCQLFNLVVLSLICASSAALALSDGYVPSNLKAMFNLPFQVTAGMVWLLILIGSSLLLLFQHFAAGELADAAFKD